MVEKFGALPREWQKEVSITAGVRGDPGIREPRFGNDNELNVRFTELPILNAFLSNEETGKVYDKVEFVRIQRYGDKSTVYFQPSKLVDRRRFAQQYQMYKTGVQDKIGTSLDTWDYPLGEGDLYGLKQCGIFSVEDLSNTEPMMISFMQDAQKAIQMAKLTMEEGNVKDKAASEAAKNRELEAKIVKMQEEFELRMTALMEQKSMEAQDSKQKAGVFGVDVVAPKNSKNELLGKV